MKKKRPFLLLEVIIALTLVIVCIVPLVRQPIYFYRSQIDRLGNFERERIADWTFSEVKELLFKNSIPWKKLPAKKQPPVSFNLPNVPIEIPGFSPQSISRSFTLRCAGEKNGKGGELFRLYYVTVILEGDHKYEYRILMQVRS